MNFIKKHLKEIKNYRLYKIFLFYIVKNIYDFIWHNILNFKGRINYFFWLFTKKNNDSFNLEKNDKKIIRDNQYFSKISAEIYDYCKENLLEKSKEELIHNSHDDGKSDNSG